jgi:hypothetical protein
MAPILSIDTERTRGLRKALVWMAKRRYGGAVPGILKILAQDLNIGSPLTGSIITYTCARARPCTVCSARCSPRW